jgi:P450-derived glycosyltransferase activator
MGQRAQAARFARDLYAQRAATWYWGHVRRSPMSLLMLGPGRRDPYAVYERMRAAGPMNPTRLGNWATTSHAICNRVLRDRRFGVQPEDWTPGQDAEFDMSFLERNPPDHTRLRRVASAAFTPRQIAGYRARIEKTVDALLDECEANREFDLVAGFAGPLPIAVITDLLGIPDVRSEEFAEIGAVIGSALDGISSLAHARRLMAANTRLERLFHDLFELRRREPGDDLVSQVVAAEGDQVAPEEMLPMCVLLLVAGFETTVNLVGNGALALTGNPDQWDALTADPGLAAAAVEEMLRFDPPVQRTGRVALEDTDLDGTPVHKNQLVVTLIGAANRDPEVFCDPARFDITRTNASDHLAFSAGIHYCLGQPLARLEAGIAFAALAERMPRLRRTGPVRRRNASTIRGPLSLPVSV